MRNDMNLFLITYVGDGPKLSLISGVSGSNQIYIVAPDIQSAINYFISNYRNSIKDIEQIGQNVVLVEVDKEKDIEKKSELHSFEYELVFECLERPSPNDKDSSIELMTTWKIAELLSKEYKVFMDQNFVMGVETALEDLNFERVPILVDFGKVVYMWKVKEKIQKPTNEQ